MHKNRRKTPQPCFNNPLSQSKSRAIKLPFPFSDKQNQAKLALLDLGNDDDTMLHIDTLLGDQHPSRNSLIEQMKAHQTQILTKKTHNKICSAHEIHALLPIDDNCNFQLDNFVEDKRTQTSGKKQRFSLRNTLYLKSKENLIPLKKELEVKRQQKTILKLKKILKKLESPEKVRENQEQNIQKSEQNMRTRKNSINKITQFCTEYLYRNIPSSNKERMTVHEFGSHQKPLQAVFDQAQQPVKFYEFRTGAKTSHQKHRSSLTRVTGGTNTPTPFFYKQTKLTNKNMLFKRNSMTTAQLGLQKNNCTGIKRASARMAHQISRSNTDQLYGDEMFTQNQKRKEQRRNRNLRNILFD